MKKILIQKINEIQNGVIERNKSKEKLTQCMKEYAAESFNENLVTSEFVVG